MAKYMGVYHKIHTKEGDEPIYFGQVDMVVKSYVKGDKKGL